MAAWRAIDGGVEIAVRVTPRASRDEIGGVAGDRIAVRLRAPPVEGEANDALVRFLAKAIGIRKSQITLIAGSTGRLKRLRLAGDPAWLESRLKSL